MMKAGEVWKINGRKGPLTVRLMEDVDPAVDGFFDVHIVEGRAQFLSRMYNDLQQVNGLGTQGTEMSLRTTLTHFLTREKELERTN